MVIAIDGPAGAGKSTVARAVARAARLHVPRHGGDVPRRRPRRGGASDEPPARSPSAIDDRASATACCSTAATSPTRSARPRSREAASRVAADPGVRAALVRQAAGDHRRRRLGRRGPRHRHRRRARRRRQGLPHRRRPRSARAAAPRRRGGDPEHGPGASRTRATSATPPPTAPCSSPRRDAVPVDTTGLTLDEVVDADRQRSSSRRGSCA